MTKSFFKKKNEYYLSPNDFKKNVASRKKNGSHIHKLLIFICSNIICMLNADDKIVKEKSLTYQNITTQL